VILSNQILGLEFPSDRFGLRGCHHVGS